MGPKKDMEAFEEFEQGLREALAHLYDPLYHPPKAVHRALGYAPYADCQTFQAALIQAVEELKPGPAVPPTARSRRLYDLLVYRFIQNLTQEETAERLGITPRHLRREQAEAIHVLAVRLWERTRAVDLPSEAPASTALSAPSGEVTPAWLSQIRQELLSLQRSAPGALADVGTAMRRAAELMGTLTSAQGVTLHLELPPSNLVAATHPTILQQILIAAIRQLVQQCVPERITLSATSETGRVRIAITGWKTCTSEIIEVPFIHEVLALQGGSATIEHEGDRITLSLFLPAVDRVVLVVDDNVDLVHVLRRYLVGTRYRIVHLVRGQEVFETVENTKPNVIVLDVMLPDVDGWELLAKLHQHPATRTIPIVVCSVVQEESLAMALGAAVYLSKPVQREQFLSALDQAFNQASTAPRREIDNNAPTC